MHLKPGGTIIEASSGNQGAATAMIGAIKGYKAIITVSEKISQEKLQTIKAYGAEVVMCPPTSFIEDPRSYHSQAVAILTKTPNSIMLNQYFNVQNAKRIIIHSDQKFGIKLKATLLIILLQQELAAPSAAQENI